MGKPGEKRITDVFYFSRNGYSMFCAELMSSMKDVPSTERMVMCSQRWKQLKQSEKDGYQKRCEQVCALIYQENYHTETRFVNICTCHMLHV